MSADRQALALLMSLAVPQSARSLRPGSRRSGPIARAKRTGGKVSAGSQVPDFATYSSGAPVAYPPLGAIAVSIGGLVAARLLSLALMLGATWPYTGSPGGAGISLGQLAGKLPCPVQVRPVALVHDARSRTCDRSRPRLRPGG